MTSGRAALTLVVAVVTILAGCGGSPAPYTPTASSQQSPTATPTPEPASTSTPAATPAPEQPVTVAIDNPTNRSYEPLVQATIDYWEANDDRHGTYTTNWTLDPDASDAEVIVEFQSNVYQCEQENTTDALGCASLLREAPDGGIPERVEIKTGYTNESTLETLKHEFGHLYGIEHGEEPMPLMAAKSSANRTAQPNASERAIPWKSETIRLYIATDSFDSASGSELTNQVENTIAYFNDGKGTAPENVTFERVSTRSEADIVVVSKDVGDETASTSMVFGRSTDSDEELEYYTNATIEVHPDVPTDEVGYHIGYWLDSFVNPDETSEPFEESGRRNDWWRAY